MVSHKPLNYRQISHCNSTVRNACLEYFRQPAFLRTINCWAIRCIDSYHRVMFLWLQFAAVNELGDFLRGNAQAWFRVPSLKEIQAVVIALDEEQKIPSQRSCGLYVNPF